MRVRHEGYFFVDRGTPKVIGDCGTRRRLGPESPKPWLGRRGGPLIAPETRTGLYTMLNGSAGQLTGLTSFRTNTMDGSVGRDMKLSRKQRQRWPRFRSGPPSDVTVTECRAYMSASHVFCQCFSLPNFGAYRPRSPDRWGLGFCKRTHLRGHGLSTSAFQHTWSCYKISLNITGRRLLIVWIQVTGPILHSILPVDCG